MYTIECQQYTPPKKLTKKFEALKRTSDFARRRTVRKRLEQQLNVIELVAKGVLEAVNVLQLVWIHSTRIQYE